ncbi:kinesin-like protein [Ephemerocybe angulata]|uniref:Kinesin-like protein n=1 Tax=Ephemerocybe angulata TaxID=980116 RepID=A0A8H6HYV5_9AGAR|nr:kinesin-like protein [Tulosesus angulatus]
MNASKKSDKSIFPSTPARTPLFTPKRAPSVSSVSSTSSLDSRKAPATPLLTANKKIKAPLSVESRRNHVQKPKSTLAPIPSTPTRSNGGNSRPRTPISSRKGGAESPMLMPAASEMDVSNVDPESVLVDFETVEPGDVSGEIDEAWLKTALQDHGKDDKVMVSVRIRPTDQHNAWIPVQSEGGIKLDPNYAKSTTATSTTSFNFDAVLTGTPNKPIYTTVARSHVHAAMDGYNAVIFAYGQTASGKTFTLSGNVDEPGIIPRSMKDVFGFIKRTPTREYLLRCSYLEIYNENIHDLLAPPSTAAANPVQIQGGNGSDLILTPLREEVITSLKGVKEVLKRGESNRRTACTDWNDRSSRSHSVFRLVIESRERGSGAAYEEDDALSTGRATTPNPMNGRHTPGLGGRQTPGLSGRNTPGLGGPKLQARGGRSVQTSVLSLIDLAGSEKATSDKERTREGKYINTSLLTLGTVIGTLADNSAKKKTDHVPFRNSKLTRLLQPSLSGNARISVICTINPDPSAIAESTSTLLFAKRIKNVKLNAQKKEVVDTDALIERYRKEIEDLKNRLAEREAEPVRNRRLSAREQIDESKAMKDLNGRIQQLTKLILTSQTVDDNKGDDSRPTSPSKLDFDMSPYQLKEELLAARNQLETQATQILSLEAALTARPPLPADAPEEEKARVIAEQAKTIRELEFVVAGYEENLGEPLRAVREDVEAEWAGELVKQLEKEKAMRVKWRRRGRRWRHLLVSLMRWDWGLGVEVDMGCLCRGLGVRMRRFKERQEMRQSGKVSAIDSGSFASHLFSHRKSGEGENGSSSGRAGGLNDVSNGGGQQHNISIVVEQCTGASESPMRMPEALRGQPSLMEQAMLEGPGEEEADLSFDELEVEHQLLAMSVRGMPVPSMNTANRWKVANAGAVGKGRVDVFGDKENVPVAGQ